MKLENMNQEFPKMPDAMRKMIEQEVEQRNQQVFVAIAWPPFGRAGAR